MFISLARPQVDMVFGDNVFTSGTAAALEPWTFHLNQVSTARILQQRLHEMSFNPIPLKSNWPEPGLKQEPQQQQRLPLRGFYPAQTQNTGEGQSETASTTPGPTNPSYVSHYSTSTEPRPICPPSANIATGSQHSDSSCWQLMPAGTATLSSTSFAIASHGGNPMWEHVHQGINPAMLEYSSFTLDIHAGVFPHPFFGMASTAMSDGDSPDHGSSTDSKLYASSDMLEAMALSDDPSHASWSISSPTSQFDDDPCVDAAVLGQQGAAGNPWVLGDGKTVSPKMLRIRSTPSPSSSSESIRTTFLAGTPSTDAGQTFLCTDIGSRVSRPARPVETVSKAHKLLPALGSSRANMPRRHFTARSDPPSPPRKLSRLRPMPRLAPGPRFGSPPAPLRSSRAQLSNASTPESDDGASDPEWIELADRSARDDFLVKHKQAGMTYKKIRRLGGFTEAESTLRGRYRTLTKSREARVRKPEWSDEDLRLLEKGVRELAHSSDLNSAKVPWRKVADYITAHGGSYHFGNSTCRKRWDELVREQLGMGKSLRVPFYDQSVSPSQAGVAVGEGVGHLPSAPPTVLSIYRQGV